VVVKITLSPKPEFLSAGALLPSTLFTFTVQGTSVFLLIRA